MLHLVFEEALDICLCQMPFKGLKYTNSFIYLNGDTNILLFLKRINIFNSVVYFLIFNDYSFLFQDV